MRRKEGAKSRRNGKRKGMHRGPIYINYSGRRSRQGGQEEEEEHKKTGRNIKREEYKEGRANRTAGGRGKRKEQRVGEMVRGRECIEAQFILTIQEEEADREVKKKKKNIRKQEET